MAPHALPGSGTRHSAAALRAIGHHPAPFFSRPPSRLTTTPAAAAATLSSTTSTKRRLFSALATRPLLGPHSSSSNNNSHGGGGINVIPPYTVNNLVPRHVPRSIRAAGLPTDDSSSSPSSSNVFAASPETTAAISAEETCSSASSTSMSSLTDEGGSDGAGGNGGVDAASCSVLAGPDAWNTTLARGASVKFSDSPALMLRRRAMLQWTDGGPMQVLVVKKPGAPQATSRMWEIVQWLTQRGIKVLVERSAQHPQCHVFNPSTDKVDFCITLGGDGTVLHLASLFKADEPLPPIISFAMGTLGFLTPFDVTDYAHCLQRVLNSQKHPLACTLRTRKRVEMRHAGQTVCVHNVLNEVVIDRGSFPGAVSLELFVDGHFVTNVDADGLIIATPSGSTAYSMSAGGPMVAPSVPCTILTPIAPLSLSFRPLVIPESSDIVINLPVYARSYARCSFDGKNAMRMRKDTSLSVTTSLCPLPMINMGTLDSDWYEGITHKLKWNQSIRQPPKLPAGFPDATGLSPGGVGGTLPLPPSSSSSLSSSSNGYSSPMAGVAGSGSIAGSGYAPVYPHETPYQESHDEWHEAASHP